MRFPIRGKFVRSVLLVFTVVPLLAAHAPQEAKVNQKKIDQKRIKLEKEAQRQYDKALKRHKDIQTKETKKRMKATKKASKKITPIKP